MTTSSQETARRWTEIQDLARAAAASHPVIAPLVNRWVLSASSLGAAVKMLLADKLSTPVLSSDSLFGLFTALPLEDAGLLRDLDAVLANDPAAADALTPLLFFKGFQGLQAARLAHALWETGARLPALLVQSRVSDVFGIDIHPAAQIGYGIMMDHATGIVIGETAVVEDDVLFWHNVTLGGRSRDNVDRHPKVRQGAVLGAGSTLIGNIEIGVGAKIGAGALVVKDVPAGATVVATPASPRA